MKEADIVRLFFIALFSPLARYMAGWNPNTLTYIALGASCLAGAGFYLSFLSPWFYLVSGVLIALSGICDCLDGSVARIHDKISLKGDFLDHFFDRLSDVVILLGLAYSPGASQSMGMICIILALLNAYLGTQMEATFQQRFYNGMGKAEMFVGLVFLSVVLWIFQGPLFRFSGVDITIVNLFFCILACLTLLSFYQRCRRLNELFASHGKQSK